MLLIGRIESLQSKENTFSRLFVTQGEMAGKIIKLRTAPKFFSSVRKGSVIRVLGDFEGDTFVVSEPAHVVRD